MTLPSRSVVRFYNKRGTAESNGLRKASRRPLGRGCRVIGSERTKVRLQLSVLVYNLGNLCRRLLAKRIDSWSLTSVQQRFVKTGGRLVKHARYYWLLLGEGHLHRRLLGDMLRRLWALPDATG
jgi:Transposase DDE domain group 1